MSRIRRLCIYCGSSSGHDAVYVAGARAMINAMAARGVGLVYGGGGIGVMGAAADAMLAAGGDVIGIIPKSLATKEVAHAGLTELHITQSMHERKQRMADYSDGFIALPGGIGTLEELFEIWTWAQLGFHAKPCAVLNVNGYFDGLIRFVDHAVAEGFLKSDHRAMLIVETDPDKLLDRLEAYQAPEVTQWVTQKEET